MASIQEVVKQMHESGESDARIQQVIDAYKQSKAQQAKDIADAKRIASYIPKQVFPPSPPVVPPPVEEEKEETTEEAVNLQNPNKELNTNANDNTSVAPVVTPEVTGEADQEYVDAFFDNDQTKLKQLEKESIIEAPLATVDDIAEGDGLFKDKETVYSGNLERIYKNEGLKVKVDDDWSLVDDGQLTLTTDAGIIKIYAKDLKDKPERTMARINDLISKTRKHQYENAGKKKPRPITFDNSAEKEIKEIKENIKNLPPGPTVERAELEQKLQVKVKNKNDQEFNQELPKLNELESKYETEFQTRLDRELSLEENANAKPGTEEYRTLLKKVHDGIKNKFSNSELSTIEDYNGGIEQKVTDDKHGPGVRSLDDNQNTKWTKKDIYDKAIENILTSTDSGFGNWFTEDLKDMPADIKKYVTNDDGTVDLYKLIADMDWSEVQSLANRFDDGDDATTKPEDWTDAKKQKWIDGVKEKLFKQANREAISKQLDLEDEYFDLQENANILKTKSLNLNDKTKSLQERIDPIVENLNSNKEKSDVLQGEINELYKEIEEAPQPTNQEELKVYNDRILDYQQKLNKYNELTEDSTSLYSKYEKMELEAKELDLEKSKLQPLIEEHMKNIDALEVDYKAIESEVAQTAADHGFALVDGIMKLDGSDYGNIEKYEEWRKSNKITKGMLDADSWLNLGQGLVQTAGKWATGTPLVAMNFLDSITSMFTEDGEGALSGDSEDYSRLDYLNDMYETYTSYDMVGKARDEDYEEGEMKFGSSDAFARGLTDGLPFMLAIMASGGKEIIKNPGALLSGPLGKRFVENLPLAMTGFNLTAMDGIIEGRKMGLSNNQANAFGIMQGSLIGLTQMIMPDTQFFKGSGAASAKEFLRNALKNISTKEGLKYVGKQYAGRILAEVAEEEVEFGLETLLKSSFGIGHSDEFFDFKTHMRLIHDTVALSGTVGLVGANADYKNFRREAFTSLKTNSDPALKLLNTQINELQKRIDKAGQIGDVEGMQMYDSEMKELMKSKNYINNFNAALKVAPELVTDEELELLTEKIRLEKLKSEQDPSFHKSIDFQLEKINQQIEQSQVTQRQQEIYQKTVDNVANIIDNTETNDGKKRTVQEFEDGVSTTINGKTYTGTATEQMMEFAKDNNYGEDSRVALSQDTYGTYLTDKDGNKVLVLNKSFSQEGGAGVNVAAHEFLHDMMQTTFAATDADGKILRDRDGNIQIDKKKAIALGGSLYQYLAQEQTEGFMGGDFQDRLAAYGEQQTNVQFQEVMNLLSDSMVTGEFQFKEGPMVKLGDYLRKVFQDKLGMDIKFNSGKDVFNFIRDYNKSVKEGNLSQAQQKVMREGAVIGKGMQKLIDSDNVRELALADSKQERLDILAMNGVDPDSNTGKAMLMSKPSNLTGLLDKYDGDKRRMISETIGKTKDGKSVYELKRGGDYINNPFVMSEFGQEIAPITETIAKRLFDPIPQNLRNGVTRGQFMNDLTAIAAGLVENEFDATKQDLDKFISNRLNLRANRLASDLGIESTVEEGGLGAAVGLDQAAELTAEESGPINDNTPGMVLLNRIASPETIEKIQKSIKSKIKGTTIEVEPGKFVDISNLDYKTLKNLVAPEVAEMFGIKSVENYLSPTKTLKNDDVIRARMYIAKHASALKAALPLGVTASGTATGTKQVIIKNFYTKSDTRVKFDRKEGGAGLFPQIKNKMNDAEFTAPFGIVKGELSNVAGQNPATLISGLMDEIGKTITNQTVRQELDKQNVAQDKDVAARIRLLGDGKSDAMFSFKDVGKLSPEKHAMFMLGLGDLKNTNLEISDGNMTQALKAHFAEEIALGTYDIPRQTTEQLIEKVGKSLQKVYNSMTNGKLVPPTQVFNGQLISDIVVDQMVNDLEGHKVSYNSVSGQQNKSINDPEVARKSRIAVKKLSDSFTDPAIKEAIAQSIGNQSKVASGQYRFKPGTFEYEVVKNYEKGSNRFGLANNIDDARALLGIEKPARRESVGGIRAYEPPKTGEGLPSQANMTRTVAENKLANKQFRLVVKELKKLYNNGDISKNDVVAILQSFNANPRGLTRMSAILDWIPTDNTYKGAYRLEHMTPALQVSLSALNSILSKQGSQADIDFENDMDGYKVAYLPMKYDKLVNTKYKATKPIYGQESIFRYYNIELPGFDLKMKQLSTGMTIGSDFVSDTKQHDLVKKNNAVAVNSSKLYFSKPGDTNAETNRKNSIIDLAVKASRVVSEPKGITVLDFDDTLATTKSRIKYTKPDGTKGSLNAEEYARDYIELSNQGYEWDFSEFNEVVGGQLAPLFNKALKLKGKFGTDNMFVLTARPAAAAGPIQAFLKAHGLDIPIENITGLGNSTSESKALWIADKVGEGYNDFYFADDALQNVQAVDNMLEQFDVKRKVQQAKLNMFSKASDMFNQILEESAGINKFATFSDAKAKKRGAHKGKYGIFIPASADDFKGLLYKFLGKGKQGEGHLKFFNDALMEPFARATQEMDRLKSRISNDFNALNKQFKPIKKMLNKTVPTGDFTYDTAIRVYNWTKQGIEIDGLSKQDQADLIKAVESNPDMVLYAQSLEQITKGYPEPGDYWMTETIASDLNNITEGIGRKEMLAEFIQNREQIFGTWQNGKLVGPNINKIEAVYGSKFRSALEDMLWRMENGTNRNFGDNALTNRFANWVNNSVGAIMFFNARSAVLQTLSTVNFINWDFNNPLKAAAAFANQPQFWKDFAMIFNSDMLKQRRSGLRSSVSHAELAEAASNSKNPAKAVFQKMLKLGFLPTQIADSFAIASGGATFYRNRLNNLIKNGMSEADAKKQAFTEFQQKAEETQQSSRPDMISQQQASPLGRLVLAFQNTPMQYTRLMKKAILDIANGRGDFKHNVSKVIYYGAVQNFIFSALQKAMFAFAFDDDDEEDKKKQKKKELSLANGMLDSLLRGMGVGGAIVSTLKNMILKFAEEDSKGWNADFDKVIIEFLNLSPPVGSKARKMKSGFSTYQYNKEVIEYMPKNTLDNPLWEMIGNIVSSTTNIPLDRVINKTNNIKEAMNSDNEVWQRIALALGWNRWDMGVENEAREEAKKEVKEIKKQKKKEKDKKKKEEKKLKEAEEKKQKGIREVRCSALTRKGKGPRCKNVTENKSGKCYSHQ